MTVGELEQRMSPAEFSEWTAELALRADEAKPTAQEVLAQRASDALEEAVKAKRYRR